MINMVEIPNKIKCRKPFLKQVKIFVVDKRLLKYVKLK